MADDQNTDDVSKSTEDQGGPEPSGDDPAAPKAGRGAEGAPDPARISALRANASVYGTLVVHFPERDVEADLDGLTALRVLTCFDRQDSTFADKLNLAGPAENGWFVVDLAQALAVSWRPRAEHDGLDMPVAFDPPA